MDNQLFTVEEAADLLGIRRSFLYTLIKRGEIGSLKVGGARRIPYSAIEAFIAEHLCWGSSSNEASR